MRTAFFKGEKNETNNFDFSDFGFGCDGLHTGGDVDTDRLPGGNPN